MIPIEKEDPELFGNTGVYEVCVFCKKISHTWHRRTNNPVCFVCAGEHKVSELEDHGKNIRNRERREKRKKK